MDRLGARKRTNGLGVFGLDAAANYPDRICTLSSSTRSSGPVNHDVKVEKRHWIARTWCNVFRMERMPVYQPSQLGGLRTTADGAVHTIGTPAQL